MRKRHAGLVYVTVVFASVLCACGRQTPSVCIEKSDGGRVCVAVETARSPAQRQLGLMYRRELAGDRGMLFLFDSENTHPFTMKNTYIPLDMIFISGDRRIIGWVENTRPLTPGPYGVEKPSRYVLEVNALFCRQQGLTIGDRVVFERLGRLP